LGSSILDESVLHGLEFVDKSILQLLNKMLSKDPSTRVTAGDALRYLDEVEKGTPAVREDVLGGGCDIFDDDDDDDVDVDVDVDIVVSLDTKSGQPLGLVLAEKEDREGVFVEKVEPRRQAFSTQRIFVGDRLIRVGSKSVGSSFSKALEFIQESRSPETPFVFSRTQSKGTVEAEGKKGIKYDGRRIKARIRGESRGAFQLLGKRKYQEDRILLQTYRGDSLTLAGVFDGHGGSEASAYATLAFQAEVEGRLNNRGDNSDDDDDSGDLENASDDIEQILRESWTKTCQAYMNQCSVDDGECKPVYDKLWGILSASTGSSDLMAGTTAALTIFNKGDYTLHSINCGDSRVIVGDINGEVKFSSRDHKPSCKKERRRLEQAGGEVVCLGAGENWRVRVNLGGSRYNYAVSRSLEPAVIADQGIVSDADYFTCKMNNAGDFAVVVTDGLTDVMDDLTIIQFVGQKLINSDLTASEIAQQLCKTALKKEASDNISVVVVSAV